MESFELYGKKFEYITVSEVLENPYILPDKDIYTRTNYMNIGCGFDIETSRISDDVSTMYVWQMSLDDITIIGREWYEFTDLLDLLQKHYNLTSKRKLLCFVHNLSYEWAFIRKHLQFATDSKRGNQPVIFAMEERKIVYFETVQHVEFRDSLILTQRPLSKLTDAYNLKTEKLVDTVDYSRIVSRETFLDNETLAYCINDVQILSEFFHKYVCTEFFKNRIKLPLTSTGIVRDELKRHFKSQDKETRLKHKKMIIRAYPSEKEYQFIFRWLFRGGFTHSNATITDIIIDTTIGSQDFKSSYPAVLLHEKFPNRFCSKPSTFFERIKNDRKFMKEKAFYGVFKIRNIRQQNTHSIESISKLIDYDRASLIADNGRLVQCDYITVALTELDYINYMDFYEWDSIECISSIKVADKKELPYWLKDLILKYYYIKETMPKDSLEYKLAKAKLNAIYGMCVTNIFNSKLVYDTESAEFYISEMDFDYQKKIEKEILLPYWGIWCTAYARFNLLHYGFKKFEKTKSDTDAVYADTDSIKYLNIIGNQYIFDNFNDRISRMNKTMYVGEYDRTIFKDIGKFDFEGKWYKSKFLGAKRYIYDTPVYNKKKGKYELYTDVKIAGCVKGSLQDYCERNNLDIYEQFSNNLLLSPADSHKKTTRYNDNPMCMTFNDYLGNEVTQEELSNVTIYDIPFTMTMDASYINLLLKLKEKNKLTLSERVWV